MFIINKNVIITGGCGFIGTNLVLDLLKNNNKIKVIDNLWRGEKKYIENLDNVSIIEEDLTDYQVCKDHIKDADIIFHLAEIVSGVKFAYENEYFIYRKNSLINSNVLHATIENNIKDYIYVGSACSYPKEKQWNKGLNYFKEEDAYPLEPETSYGMTKFLGEYEALLAMKENKINVGILRLHNVYGPYCSLDLERMQVIPSLILKTIKSKDNKLEVWGSGNQYRDFIYVDDVIEGLKRIYEKGMNKGVIQIGAGFPTSIKDTAQYIINIHQKNTNQKVELFFDTTKLEGDFGRISINTKAEEILDLKCKIGVEEGLNKLYDWINIHI